MQDARTNIFALTKQDTAVLKGIAIIAMLLHHLYGCAPTEYLPFDAFLSFLGDLGKVCVALFLFCSGYGLSVGYGSLSLVSESASLGEGRLACIQRNFVITLKFLVKRFVKFYAGYWLIFLIFVPIGVFVFNRSLSVPYGEDSNIIKCLVLDILGLQGLSSYNITWWFNKLIIILYLSYPVLDFLVKKGGCFFMFVSLLCMRFDYKLGFVNYYGLFFWQFPMVLGIFWHEKENLLGKIKIGCKWARDCVCALSILLVITLTLYRDWQLPMIPHIKAGMYMDSFLCLAIVLAVVSCRPYLVCLERCFSFLGSHSMNIYMTHTFIFSYWFASEIYSCEVAWGGAFVVLLVICLTISVVMEWIKEKSRYNKLLKFVIDKI